MSSRGEPENANRQAADWLARLHADDRSETDDAAFRTWLRADPRNAEAFERASNIWESIGGLRDRPLSSAPSRSMLSRRAVFAGGATVLIAGGLTLGWREASAGVYQTAVGEQRRLRLDDGTRLMLDTATRVRFSATAETRQLSIAQGRVDIQIAADPRPFLIDAGERRASSRGGRIDVRRDGERVALTAIEGSAQAGQSLTPLSPGKRITMVAGNADRIDQPEIDDLIAWQNGRLAFRDETLAQAFAEMNRYTKRPLIVSDTRVAQMRLSGIYRVGDPEAFARSLAVLLPVRVHAEADSIRISSIV